MPTIKYAHIISHTHWDREWYLNSKYTNQWLVPFFEALFNMMKKEPRYRFVLDGQTLMIEDYFEQLKLQGMEIDRSKALIKKYAAEKRLVIGPYYLQPDWQLISEESIIRNLLIGMEMAREYGGSMQVGWLLDNFGQISQAPQVHQGFNLQGLFVWRGVEMAPAEVKSEFIWKAPDGTEMLAIYFLSSYRNAMRLAERNTIMAGRIKSEVEKIGPLAATPNVLLMNGYDQEMVPDDILPYLNGMTENLGDLQVIQSIPEEYLQVVKKARPEIPTLQGALYSGRYISVFPGNLSSRMYLKTQNDCCQKKLEKYTEPLETILSCLGWGYRQEQLLGLWKLLLKNHPHDSICGVSIDDVHTDMEERLTETGRLAETMIHDNLKKLSATIDTSRYENAISIFHLFNPLLQQRDEAITLKDEFPPEISIRDSRGRVVPLQRDGKGKLIIWVHQIPALGYETIFILPKQTMPEEKIKPEKAVSVDIAGNMLENSFMKLHIQSDGSLEVTDKMTGTIYRELGIFEDGADAGDEYNYSYPEQDILITSKNKKAEICYYEVGPLEVQVRIKIVLDVPEQLSTDRKTRCQSRKELPIVSWMTMTAGSPVLKFRTEVYNTVKDHRLRVLFPTWLSSDYSYAETQFDVVAREINPARHDDSLIPENIKRIIVGAREPRPVTIFPQRTFVNIHDGESGLSVLNQGLPEYEILPTNNTVALTLFRGVNWIARPDLLTRIGDAGPMIAVPDAQCIRRMEFKYALYLHKGDWQAARVIELADQFNTGLLMVKAGPHQGVFPGRLEFMNFQHHQGLLKVTAVKRSEDGSGVIVRFHNPTDMTVESDITTFFQVNKAYYTDLNETVREGIEVSHGRSVRVTAKPKKIITLKLELEQVSTATHPITKDIQIVDTELDETTDFADYPAVARVSAQEVAAEERRALELVQTFSSLERKTVTSRKNMTDGSVDTQLELSQLQLDTETYRRASLEARLSAIFIKKKYLEAYHLADGLYQKYLHEIDPVIRDVGYELNKARVNKRLLEYIVDFYHNQKKTAPAD